MPETETDPSSYVTSLLNRIEAIIDCGAGRTSELAAFLRPEDAKAETRVTEWIRARRRTPNGEMSLRLHQWAEAKTLEIAKHPTLPEQYRKAFAAVEKRRK